MASRIRGEVNREIFAAVTGRVVAECHVHFCESWQAPRAGLANTKIILVAALPNVGPSEAW